MDFEKVIKDKIYIFKQMLQRPLDDETKFAIRFTIIVLENLLRENEELEDVH